VTRSAKVMLLGDVGVGKSSLARRLIFSRFDAEYKTTIGVDVMTYDLNMSDGPLRLILWDTDGDFGMSIFETVYMRGASAAIVVADASRPATLVKMTHLARGMAERLPGREIRAVVNKIDLADPERLTSAENLDPHTITRTSARTGDGVRELFEGLGAAILRRGF
jgi:Ras-related protein Rab-5C